MASQEDSSNKDKFLALPRIEVDNISVDQAEAITPSRSTTTEVDSPSNLYAPSSASGFRERSMSGSTVVSSRSGLSAPKSPVDDNSTAASFHYATDELEDPLQPEVGMESDFVVSDNKFAFSPGQLNKLLNPKSLQAYAALGGIRGLERGLRTNLQTGLSVDETNLEGAIAFEEATQRPPKSYGYQSQDSSAPRPSDTTPAQASSEAFADRIRIFKKNTLPEKKPTPLWKLVWRAYNDKVLILLTVAAVISLALGLYETFGVEHDPNEPMPVDWVEGVAIVVAIIIVVLVGSVNDYQKERAFVKLSAKKEDREVKVLRSGRSIMISVHDVLVGDILHLEAGDLVCADGIFIGGHNVKCDESSATGESDQLKKTGGEQVMKLMEQGHTNPKDMDPFIISGSKVLEGVGTFLVTSVGVNSSYGKILMAMRQDMEATPLQIKLDRLATAIAKLGSSAAGLLFFVLLFRFVATLSGNERTGAEKASQFTDILIVAITVIVVAVPEGLPLAVTLALAFATTRLVKLNNLVRVFKSCETMGNATTICSDKTGTLTTNKMTVVTGTFLDRSFDDKNNLGGEERSTSFAQSLSPEEKHMIIDSIAINSTAFEGEENGQKTFIGSKTETALLAFASNVLGMGPLSEERANAEVVQLMPFDSGRKCMSVVQKLPGGIHRFLVKGASEVLLGHCTLEKDERQKLEGVIDSYAKQSLRTIALVYRDFAQWPPVEAVSSDNSSLADLDRLLHDMNFLGVVGIQDPVRPGVPEAVKKCQHAGVTVRMVTGDNIVTAKAIATECGIYTDGIVIEGPVFRNLNDQQMKETLPSLQVLARSSPEDKRILVTKLREMGQIVAVTGDGTNDGPALKAADIGFSMGLSGTEVAKEASQIVLMDDNFASILTALMWGRAVNDAVKKFLQFQITVNITAVIITFVSAVVNPDMKSVLTAVQLLWINLIMDSLAALALATDPPTEQILDRKPSPRNAPLISTTMWKMIIGQTIFQLIVTFSLYYGGPRIANVQADNTALRSMVFNTFVWMQIFNEVNNRRLDNKFNIFQGILQNYYFIGVNLIMVGAQIAIAFVGRTAFSIQPINGWQWGVCLGLAALCLPWAVVVRLFPDNWFAAVVKIVAAPVLFIYRPLSRFTSRIGRMLRRSKKDTNNDTFTTEAGAETPEPNHTDAEKGRR